MIYRFDAFELDTAAQELRRDGASQAVEPQVFALLVHLVEKRDRVVSRDDILAAIWHGRIVSEAALSSRVKAARQAIGDDGQAQRLIRTVHKRGFRFIGDVEMLEPTPAPAAEILLPEAAASGDTRLPPGTLILPPTSQPSIAILPFQTIGEPGLLADGLAHDLITRLGRTRWLFVIARGSAFRFKGSEESPSAIAGRLGVRYIAHGAVQTVGRHIRLHAALTDATSGAEVWSEQFDRLRDDLFAVQTEMSDAIAGAVETQIEHLERGRSLLKPSENLDAWEAYHRGCWHMYKFRPKHYEEAERYFLRSIELDPSSPRPFSGLSFVHWQRAFLEISKDRAGENARATELAEEAIALDPRDPQGYHALGRAHLLSGDIEGSERELQKAVDLNPSFAIGQYSLARTLLFAGLAEESQEAANKAERLSPYDPMRFAILSTKAMNLLSFGALDEAVKLIGQAVEESNAHYHILAIAANVLAAAGKGEESAEYLAKLRDIRPDYNLETYLRAFPLFRAEDIGIARRVFG
jgi:TolB-like protein/DNA-binding winged helix-turn-helix (wHTH) protein